MNGYKLNYRSPFPKAGNFQYTPFSKRTNDNTTSQDSEGIDNYTQSFLSLFDDSFVTNIVIGIIGIIIIVFTLYLFVKDV